MVPPHLLPVPLGQLAITPTAAAALAQPDVVTALRRHSSGDWGEVDDDALRFGTRLLSAYTSAGGTPFWVITEADRSVTTVLLPDDY